MSNIDGFVYKKRGEGIKNMYYISVVCNTSEGFIEQSYFYTPDFVKATLPLLAHIFYNEDDEVEGVLSPDMIDYVYELVPSIDSPNYEVTITNFFYIDKNGDAFDVIIDLPEYQI